MSIGSSYVHYIKLPQCQNHSKDSSYFSYYGMITHQQNMLQDISRTSTYYNAVMKNSENNFKGKVILDIGAGSGILSWFSLLAEAKHVYCLEAAEEILPVLFSICEKNGWKDRVTVLIGKLEAITLDIVKSLPHKIDTIISEPMGVLLLHERMIESYILARDLFLRTSESELIYPQSMFPFSGRIYLSPFSDVQLYLEAAQKAKFWKTKKFHDINLSSIFPLALTHYISQPVIGSFSPYSLLSHSPVRYEIDFTKIQAWELKNFVIDLQWDSQFVGIMHGIAGWFDVSFFPESQPLVLSTSPYSPATHWHQVRFLLPRPIAVNIGQTIQGKMHWSVNEHRSYNISISLHLVGTEIYLTQEYKLNEQQYVYNYINNTPFANEHLCSFEVGGNFDEIDDSKIEGFGLFQ